MENKHLLILGKSGTGKTHLIKSALSQGKFGNRIFIIDIKGAEYADLGKETTFLDACKTLKTMKKDTPFLWRFVPESESQIQMFCRLALTVGNCVVIAEEVSEYARLPKFRVLLTRGRSEGVQTVCIAQRPADVHRSVQSQCAMTIAFFTDDSRDLQWVLERYDQNSADEVRTLDKSKYEIAVWGETHLYNQYFK